jgi:hypothetical protein
MAQETMMMKFASPIFAAVLASSVFARPVVIELFTSQGCSSCPPADKLLTRLATQKNVIALTWPVTVWDRLGWKDSFARSSNTQRQVRYNSGFGENGVYTPQAVLDGQTHTVGSHEKELVGEIAERQMQPVNLAVTVMVKDRKSLNVVVAQPTEPVDIRLLRLKSRAQVNIGRGENGGATLTYSNIVLDDIIVATGTKAFTGQIMSGTSDAVAVLVESRRTHEILGAALLQIK